MRKIFLAASIAALAVIGCKKVGSEGTPQIKPVNEDAINVPAEGGSFSVSYTLENPVEGGQISAATEQTEWISDIDYSNVGEVSFTVAANDSETRNGSITVTYTYSDTEISFTANIIQAGAADGGAPVIKPETENMTVFAEGGSFQLNYSIVNPVADGKISASVEDSWISNIDCSQENVISFKVEAYTKADPRETKMTIEYTYPDGKISKFVTITQEASDNPSAYDIELTAYDFSGFYYGDDYSPSLANYFVNLSDIGYNGGYVKPNGAYARLDIYSSTYASDNNLVVPEGTYTYTGTKEDGSLGSMSVFYTTDESTNALMYYIKEGTLTVSRDGNDYKFDFVCTSTDGTTIHVVYNGPQYLEDRRQGHDEETTESTVNGDYAATLNGSNCIASYKGDVDGKSAWRIDMTPNSGLGDGFMLNIYSSTTGFGNLPTGTFTADGTDNYYVPGTIANGSTLSGTMILIYELANQITGFSLIKSGDITITKEDNGTYTINIDTINDKGNKTTGTWNGKLTYENLSSGSAPKPLAFTPKN